jgi:hypothetical protein
LTVTAAKMPTRIREMHIVATDSTLESLVLRKAEKLSRSV